MKTIITYFSASGITKKLAEAMAIEKKADVFEIKPIEPYTTEDLDWRNPNSRSSIEMKEKRRVPFVMEDIDFDNYDTVYVGFPIWWYVAPTIINTFFETYQLKNKKIVLFATSGGSDFGKTVEALRNSVDSSNTIVLDKVVKN